MKSHSSRVCEVINLLPLSSQFTLHCLLCKNRSDPCKHFPLPADTMLIKLCQQGVPERHCSRTGTCVLVLCSGSAGSVSASSFPVFPLLQVFSKSQRCSAGSFSGARLLQQEQLFHQLAAKAGVAPQASGSFGGRQPAVPHSQQLPPALQVTS